MAGICRLCAVIKKSPHLTPITRCGIDFLNTVETVCNIKIDLNENNTLSRSVCSTCIEIVRKIDEFSSNVISSQSTLKLISNPIESNDRSDSPTIESIDLSTESEDEPLSKTQDKKKEKIIIKIEPKKSSIKKHSWTSVTSQCFGCSKKTIGILNIKNHLENCNKIEQNGRKIICGICRNKFISWHNYRVHIHRHAPHLKKICYIAGCKIIDKPSIHNEKFHPKQVKSIQWKSTKTYNQNESTSKVTMENGSEENPLKMES